MACGIWLRRHIPARSTRDFSASPRSPAKSPPQRPGINLGKVEATNEIEEQAMKKERRWMKSALAASTESQVTMPWARSTRRRPEALKTAAPKPRAMAAR